MEQVQQEIKQFIENKGFHLVLDLNDKENNFLVGDETGNKVIYLC